MQENTTAGRLLDKRGGDCGYMAIFQVDDLDPVRARLDDRDIRVVFQAQATEIEGLHLHPKDVPGAIVSIDATTEPSEWTWAGHRVRLTRCRSENRDNWPRTKRIEVGTNR